MRRLGVMMVVVASVAAAGCGARATVPPAQLPSDTSTETTVEVGDGSVPAATAASPTTTTPPSDAELVDPPDVATDEIDSMLSDIDDTLAELDQILNDAAAALAAEEGEIIP